MFEVNYIKGKIYTKFLSSVPRIPNPESRIPSLILLFTLLSSITFSSCSESASDKPKTKNDSIPEVLAKLNEKISDDTNNAENYYIRSKYYFDQKKQFEALEDISHAINLQPKNPLYHFKGGEYLFAIGKTRKCADAMLEAVRIKPDYIDAWHRLSELYIIGKDFDSAQWCFKQLEELDPANPKTPFFKGEMYKDIKADTGHAIALFQKATELDATYWQAWLQLGIIFSAKNNPLCLQYFGNVLRNSKNNVEALYARGDFLRRSGKLTNAENDFKFVKQLDPGHYLANYNLGVIYFQQNKLQQAVEEFSMAIEKKEDYAYAWYSRGLCHYQMGNKATAKKDLEKCLELDKEHFKNAEVLLKTM